MQSLLLTATEAIVESESSSFNYIAAAIVASVGIAYYLMSAPVSAPAGAVAAAAPAPVRVSEGTPNPERVFTLAELRKYDGSDPTGPIYIGAAGKVFDVTSGAGFYGPGGPYGCFAGTDASRGLAKMDLKSTQYGVDDLTATEKNTLKEWADKYETKYPVVGKIVDASQPNSGPAPAGGWPAAAATTAAPAAQ